MSDDIDWEYPSLPLLSTMSGREGALQSFFHMMTDELLGYGVSRRVYSSADGRTVVKVGCGFEGIAQNLEEWNTWMDVQFTDHKVWFAPCVDISVDGRILTQRLAKDVRFNSLPERVPSYFTDLKLGNWGRYAGRVVCRDYGLTLLRMQGLHKRTKKADWRV